MINRKSLMKTVEDIGQLIIAKENAKLTEEDKDSPNEEKLETLDQEIDLLQEIAEKIEEYIDLK